MVNLLKRSPIAVMIAIVLASLIVPATAYADETHIVRRGETLSSIAASHGTTVSALVRTNGLRNPNFIYAGQRLRIITSSGSSSGGSSSGGVYVVRRGDTLAGIAARYHTTVARLMASNGIRNPNLIFVGQRIRLSGSSSGGGSSGGGGSGGGTVPAPTSGKWIEVDISAQRTYAHEGDSIVKTMVVSTGISRYPTPTGTFRVYRKYEAVAMSGPGYYLPGVPHTMFFYRGYALHGTYWHNNFGHPMSHGCINLTKADAAWLYSWTPMGTKVVIHQ